MNELFDAPEVHVSKSQDSPSDAALEACVRGELPQPVFPRSRERRPETGDWRRELILDLDWYTGHFVKRRQHVAGMGALWCLHAASLRGSLAKKDSPVNPDTAGTLVPVASKLLRCLDGLEQWPRIRGYHEDRVTSLGDPLIVPRWSRLLDLSNEVAREAGDPAVVPEGSDVLRLEDLNDLKRRTGALAEKAEKMFSVANSLLTLTCAQTLNDDRLRGLLTAYEALVADFLGGTARRGGDAEAATRRVATYDSMRPEVLFLERQMSAMRDDLLGARTVRNDWDAPGFPGVFQRG